MSRAGNMPHSLSEKPVIHVHQGEYFISGSRPVVACTVLGSCVAVIMYDPELKLGAMNHGVMPRSATCVGRHCGDSAYFVDSSTQLIYKELLQAGADSSRLVVKVFGAASVLSLDRGEQGFRMGCRNREAVLDTLRQLGLEAYRIDLGGERGRKIVFDPHNGDVWVKKLVRNGGCQEVPHE
jgi:chemotaxis protein CheD